MGVCRGFLEHLVIVWRGRHILMLWWWYGGRTYWIFLSWSYWGISCDIMWILWIVWCVMGMGGWVHSYPWGLLGSIWCPVAIGPYMCICWGGMCTVLTNLGLCCVGVGCVGCRHLRGCSIWYVCWIGVCELFGKHHCYAGLCKDLLCVGEYK